MNYIGIYQSICKRSNIVFLQERDTHSSNFNEKFLVSVAMSGQFSGMCIALVEEVLTCAHTPQEYHKVC